MQKKEDEERREEGNATPLFYERRYVACHQGKIKAQKKEITMGKKGKVYLLYQNSSLNATSEPS